MLLLNLIQSFSNKPLSTGTQTTSVERAFLGREQWAHNSLLTNPRKCVQMILDKTKLLSGETSLLLFKKKSYLFLLKGSVTQREGDSNRSPMRCSLRKRPQPAELLRHTLKNQEIPLGLQWGCRSQKAWAIFLCQGWHISRHLGQKEREKPELQLRYTWNSGTNRKLTLRCHDTSYKKWSSFTAHWKV